MTPELFSDAMNEIGAKYVEEALTYKRPAQRSFWSKLAKRAAMVALVALLALSGFAAASPAARATATCAQTDWPALAVTRCGIALTVVTVASATWASLGAMRMR